MKLFIYLQIKPIEKISFSSALALQLKKELPDLVLFEADQESDSFQINIGKDLIEKADQIFVLIENDSETKIGALSQIFESLRKFNKGLLTYNEGSSKAIKTMIKMSGANALEELSVELIKSFYQSA